MIRCKVLLFNDNFKKPILFLGQFYANVFDMQKQNKKYMITLKKTEN